MRERIKGNGSTVYQTKCGVCKTWTLDWTGLKFINNYNNFTYATCIKTDAILLP